MTPKCLVIKLGGAALGHPETLKLFTTFLLSQRALGHKLLVVHGGGPAINEALTQRGITWQFINGQRQTTAEMMQVIEDVLFAKVNRDITETLAAAGLSVQSVSGSQHGLLRCRPLSQELLQVGEVIKCNLDSLSNILDSGKIPVIAPIGCDEFGTSYNINADWAAAQIAAAISADELIFLTDQSGILDSSGDPVGKVMAQEIHSLIASGVILGGMLTKVRAMLFAAAQGVAKVRVAGALSCNQLMQDEKVGSTLVNQRDFTPMEVIYG